MCIWPNVWKSYKISAAPVTNFKSVFKLRGGKFNVRGLAHSASQPFVSSVNPAPISSPCQTSYIVSEEQIEQDELNTHECMLPLMKLLDHMDHNKINPEVPKVPPSG